MLCAPGIEHSFTERKTFTIDIIIIIIIIITLSLSLSLSVLIIIIIIAFDEGRTLPNLLGCLLSRRFPCTRKRKLTRVFFVPWFTLFGAILNDVTISLRKAFCLVLRCLSDALQGSNFIILSSCFAVCRTCWKVQALSFCLVLRCFSDVLEGSSFIILPRVSLFVGRVGRFKLYHSASCFAISGTCWKAQALSF